MADEAVRVCKAEMESIAKGQKQAIVVELYITSFANSTIVQPTAIGFDSTALAR